MNKILLIYWPEGGNVETIALKLREKLMDTDITKRTVTDVTIDDMESNDNWIIGGSTVGSHVWEDADDSNKWVEFFKMLDVVDMTKKTVAFFGLGDHILYPNHFVDGLGVFQEEFSNRNANIVGKWPTEGYTFSDSEGVDDDMFYGLALDEDHEDELTEQRLNNWLELIKKDFN